MARVGSDALWLQHGYAADAGAVGANTVDFLRYGNCRRIRLSSAGAKSRVTRCSAGESEAMILPVGTTHLSRNDGDAGCTWRPAKTASNDVCFGKRRKKSAEDERKLGLVQLA